MKKERLQELAGVQLNEEANVILQIQSEGGTELVSIDQGSATQIKKLLKGAKEWPDEVNELLDKGKVIEVAGIVNTMGDGFGWHEPE
jgi:3-dehydroquinate synthase class II